MEKLDLGYPAEDEGRPEAQRDKVGAHQRQNVIEQIEAFLQKAGTANNNWDDMAPASLLKKFWSTGRRLRSIARRNKGGHAIWGYRQLGRAARRSKRVIGPTAGPNAPCRQDVGLTSRFLHGPACGPITRPRSSCICPRNPRIHRLYGLSPVEQVVMTVNIALRRSVAQLNYFTEGNIPEALISVPPDWTPTQIREMQQIFDDMLRGNLSERAGAKFIPGGLNVQFMKEALLKDDFDEWLVRIICYAFSVSPTPFTKQTNRATAESVHQAALQEGLFPLQNWVKGLIDRVLAEDFGAPDLEFSWNDDRAMDPLVAMQISTGYVAAGLKTRNEVRSELGDDPIPDGDEVTITAGNTVVRLSDALAASQAQPEPTEEPEQPAKEEPKPDEGSTPNKPVKKAEGADDDSPDDDRTGGRRRHGRRAGWLLRPHAGDPRGQGQRCRAQVWRHRRKVYRCHRRDRCRPQGWRPSTWIGYLCRLASYSISAPPPQHISKSAS